MNKTGLLLDTHILLWLANGDHNLHKQQQSLINDAAKEWRLYISAISAWEIAMLDAKQRIILSKPCLKWIQESIEKIGIQLIPLSLEISVESCQLPGTFHDDPVDRIIVASARIHNLALMTHDDRILHYSNQDYVQTIKT
ncbi:MAG: type II toxin-antitoxin system VapC family toxin [Pseudomonadota bacterium]